VTRVPAERIPWWVTAIVYVAGTLAVAAGALRMYHGHVDVVAIGAVIVGWAALISASLARRRGRS
jgi:hypothetical protein